MNINLAKSALQQQSNTHVVGIEKNNSKKTNKEEQSQLHNGTYFAGNLNLQQNEIGTKQAEAQKKAMKLKIDQLKQDVETDNNIEKHVENKNKYEAEGLAAQKEISSLNDLKSRLKETYGVDDNSEEQKNLNVLEKSMDPSKTLTDEEMERLKNMGPLTDYQKDSIRYDAMEQVWKQRLDNANQGKANEGQTVVGIKLALLKEHPMTDAQKEAAKIMENASDQVISMIVNKAKEKVEEKIEKEKEEGEKQAEEAKKKEEMTSKQPETVSEQVTKNVQEAGAQVDKVMTELKVFIDKNKVLDEDVKGIVVDEQL